MNNYKPIIALSLALVGFFISLSVAFLDLLGPKKPLPRKNIFDILKTANFHSSQHSNEETISTDAKRILAEKYLNQQEFVHKYSDLKYSANLSDPEIGNFIFFSALCYGNSKPNCKYLNAYIISPDKGNTWKINFLE
tara:strand:- start:359 stop:769 length:411 start_codon:yes stop_codon:yes gene_type:complete